MVEGNGFDNYKLLLLDWHEQDMEAHKRIEEKLDQQALDITSLKNDISSLQVKARIAGAVTGFLASTAVAIAVALFRK